MTQRWLLSLSAVALGIGLGGCAVQYPASYTAYGVDKGAGSRGIHTVLEGDTVYTVAENYKLPMREIITLNHIQAPYSLQTGYRLKLPPPNEYQVRHGDTVKSIAKMYEVSVNRLVSLNNLAAPYKLKSGQVLRLPTPSQIDANMNIEEARYNAEAVQGQQDSRETIQGARVNSVERVDLSGQADIRNNNMANANINTPVEQAPARVQTASMQQPEVRAKIPETPKMSGNGKYMQPVNGRIISNFGAKADGLYNDGINIQAARGTSVRAAENGVVVYTGSDLEGYGNLILVRHENKMMSAYAHLDKTLIKRGDKVMRGQSIGTVGSTGQVDSPQLHFELRRGSEALDPSKYL